MAAASADKPDRRSAAPFASLDEPGRGVNGHTRWRCPRVKEDWTGLCCRAAAYGNAVRRVDDEFSSAADHAVTGHHDGRDHAVFS